MNDSKPSTEESFKEIAAAFTKACEDLSAAFVGFSRAVNEASRKARDVEWTAR